jgi:hypothetical protein
MSQQQERWIVVRNWGRFQHYGDRSPPWIKLYTELNSDPNWLGLSLAERGLLVTIWLEYARSRGQVATTSPQLVRTYARTSHFKSLSDAGFIAIVASKPLAIARSREVEQTSKVKDTQSQERALGDFRRTPSRARGTHEGLIHNEETWNSPTWD